MKTIYFMIVLLFVGLMSSCQESETLQYENRPMINFVTLASNYSFIGESNLTEKSLWIDLHISGFADVNCDRTVQVQVIADSTTATAYEIKPIIIKRGAYTGQIEVVVANVVELAQKEVELQLRLIDSEDFRAGNTETRVFKLSWSNRLIQPANWNELKRYMGEYSTAYYKFIIDVTGRTEFPYRHPDKRLTPMSLNEMKSWAVVIRDEVAKYNALPENKDKPLIHDDGVMAGQAVIVPVS